LEARKGFRIFTQIKNQVMDELYQYHPENPKQVDVVSEFKALAERKAEIEAKLG